MLKIKHNLKINLILVLFFLLSQLFGVFLIGYDMERSIDPITKKTVINFSETSIGERPEIEGYGTVIFLGVGILIGTLLILFLATIKKPIIWKVWYFIAIWMTITITTGVFFKHWSIFFVSFLIALLKVFKQNFYIHNITEIFVYSGIAFMLVPLFDLMWVFVMLILISIYDAIAVWQSKHMIKLAMFQKDSKVFAGLNVSYGDHRKVKKDKNRNKEIKSKKINNNADKMSRVVKTKSKNAILGGGDIAFPLIFTGVCLVYFFNNGFSKMLSYLIVFPIIFFSTLSVFLLLYFGKPNKFYPAMPFISFGCVFGFMLSFFISTFL